MSLVTSPSAAASSGMIATMIVGVLAFSTFLGWGVWRVFQRANRAENDPRYLRRLLMRAGLLYVCGVVLTVEQVATGKEPKTALLGLPIAALLVWTYFRAAIKVKVPPQ